MSRENQEVKIFRLNSCELKPWQEFKKPEPNFQLRPPRWVLESQLLIAIRENDVSRARSLLSAGVDVDTTFSNRNQKSPALCLAIEGGHVDMVELLLDLGANVNQSDPWTDPALYLACDLGHTHVAQMLLTRARPNVNTRGVRGDTALHLAVREDNLNLVEELVTRGADLTIQDGNGMTPLHKSAAGGYPRIFCYLLHQDSPIDILDNLNNSPLSYVLSNPKFEPQHVKEAVEGFPQALCIVNKQGNTPLLDMISARSIGLSEVLRTLLELAMDRLTFAEYNGVLSQRTDLGQSLLHLVVLEKQFEALRVLLAAGAEVNTRNNLGYTPLDYAAKCGQCETVAILLAAGASTRTLVREMRVITSVTDPWIIQALLKAHNQPARLSSQCRKIINKNKGLLIDPDFLAPRWKYFLDHRIQYI